MSPTTPQLNPPRWLKVNLFFHRHWLTPARPGPISSPTKPPSQCGQAFIEDALPLHLPPRLTIFVPPRPKLIPLVNSAVQIAEGSLTNEEGSVRQWKALTWLSASWQGLGDIILIVGHAQGSYSSNSSEPTTVTIKEIIHAMRRNGIKRLLALSTLLFLLPDRTGYFPL
jgi:hypothetical protein